MQIDTWSQYQAAAQRTAQYPHDQRWDYLSLGLVSEVGELCGKLKREIRDGAPRDVDALVLELGDVMWYLAQLASESAIVLDAECDAPTKSEVGGGLMPAARELTGRAAWAAQACSPGRKGRTRDVAILNAVDATRWVAAELGFDLATVCERNVAKLVSRQLRGVVKGEGDER